MADVQRARDRGRRGVDRVDLLPRLGAVEGVGAVGLPLRATTSPRALPAPACPVRRRRRAGVDSDRSCGGPRSWPNPTERAVVLPKQYESPVRGRHLDSRAMPPPCRRRPSRPRPTPRSRTRCSAVAGDQDRPDAGPDRGFLELLGDPQGGYPVGAPDRHQRQDLDRADDRDPDPHPRAAHRSLHQPAPGVDDRADQGRRRAAERGGVRPGVQRHRAVPRPRRRPSTTTRCRSSRRSSAMAYATFADAPVDAAVVEVGMGGTWDATNVVDAQGRGDHADRRRPREVPRRRRRPTSPGRSPGSSSPARPWSPRCRTARWSRGAGRAVRRGGRDAGARGHRVRRRQPGARGRRPDAGAAGPARRVRRGLPAAVRRPPGAERRARAGRGRGVHRRRRRARRRRGARGVRRGDLAGPARGDPAEPDDRARRGPQPARRRRRGRRARRLVRVRPAGRRASA